MEANRIAQVQICLLLERGRTTQARPWLSGHLSINSIQNKLEEFETLSNLLKAHVIVISETKIDESYPNTQFNLKGYLMYRQERKKGGGGLMVYFSSLLPSKKLKLAKPQKLSELAL